jgi:single-strand selective monofunctional uracil DNA glycosylase
MITSRPANDAHEALVAAAKRLSKQVDKLTFDAPVSYVYNPLSYAWKSHQAYLLRSQPATTRVLFLGMNPGPWGMTQTGVPFGQVAAVRDWLKIDEPIERPKREHPKRPVEGLLCKRSEVSGERLWNLFRDRFEKPEKFFREHFVTNYCPLVFMEESSRNRTPDKLRPAEAKALQTVCDQHLRSVIECLSPKFLVGVGAYAEQCLQRVCDGTLRPVGTEFSVLRILHPSPASPAANRNWAEIATSQLIQSGVWRP